MMSSQNTSEKQVEPAPNLTNLKMKTRNMKLRLHFMRQLISLSHDFEAEEDKLLNLQNELSQLYENAPRDDSADAEEEHMKSFFLQKGQIKKQEKLIGNLKRMIERVRAMEKETCKQILEEHGFDFEFVNKSLHAKDDSCSKS